MMLTRTLLQMFALCDELRGEVLPKLGVGLVDKKGGATSWERIPPE